MTKRRSQAPRARQVTQPKEGGTDIAAVQVPQAPDQEPPSPDELLALIRRLEQIRDSRVLTFVCRPDVTVRGDVVLQVYEQLRHIGRVPSLDVFLHSAGGQTEIPWRLITLIRDFADRFTVLIPAMAYSAATHLAMGADEIVMGPPSELSPVDPARSHPLLPSRDEGAPPPPVSVQDLRHCMEFVKRELGNGSPESLSTILATLFDKIHPLAIGAIQQSYELSRLISAKALSTHMDPTTEKDRIDRIVTAFSDEFFSHHYRIGWKEARDTGLKVALADAPLWETIWAIFQHYQSYFALVREIEGGSQVAQPIVWIDSSCQRRILESILTKTSDRRLGVLQPQKTESRWISTEWEQTEPESGKETCADALS